MVKTMTLCAFNYIHSFSRVSNHVFHLTTKQKKWYLYKSFLNLFITNKVKIVKIYDVVFDWSVGGNDIPQCRHFMKMNPGFNIHIVDEPRTLRFDHDYHYNFKQVAIDGIAESGVSFRIEEHYRMTNTSGGSCFYVFSETV